MPELRWRVHKSTYTGRWMTFKTKNGMRLPGTTKMWRTWAVAMGYVNLKIAQAQGRLP